MGKAVYCNICSKEFKTVNGRNRHKRMLHKDGNILKYSCRFECGRMYTVNDSKIRHERTCDLNPNIHIGYGIHQQYYSATSGGAMKEVQTAHKGNYKLYRKEAHIKKSFKENLENIISDDVSVVIKNQQGNIKFCIAITVIFQKALQKEVFTDPPIYFTTTPTPTTSASTLANILDGMAKDLNSQIDTYTKNGSGWKVYEIKHVDVQVRTNIILYFIFLQFSHTKYLLAT